MYPYGLNHRDMQIEEGSAQDSADAVSDPIRFSGGFPFGRERFSFVHVSCVYKIIIKRTGIFCSHKTFVHC